MNANISLNVQYIGRYVVGEEMTNAERKPRLAKIREEHGLVIQPDPMIGFLLSEIDMRDAALKLMLNAFSSADLVWHQRKAVAEALEALGKCFVCRNTETCPDCGSSLVDIGLGD